MKFRMAGSFRVAASLAEVGTDGRHGVESDSRERLLQRAGGPVS